MLLTGHKMNRRILSESEIRRQVEKARGAPVPQWAWNIAKLERAVSEVQQGDDTAEWLAQKLKAYIDTGGPRSTDRAPKFLAQSRRQRRGAATLGRNEAVSSALAEIARQSDDVRYFRRDILNDKPLRFEEVENWIQEQQKKEIYSNAVIVRIKKGSKLRRGDGWQLDPPLSSIGPEQIEGLAPVDGLAYARKDSKVAEYVPIGRDGPLRTTWRLSSSLATTFRWQEAQATMFLLTDVTPLLTESVQIDRAPMTSVAYGGADRSDTRSLRSLSCLTRVTLTIDPMMTPREVSLEYRQLRARILGRKPRVQSEKHLQLAVFAVKHLKLDKVAMAQWNLRFPPWKHQRLSLFARDGRVARERLLHEHPVDPWKEVR
jgi:hypothetical protein